jgi:hypothetical protein
MKFHTALATTLALTLGAGVANAATVGFGPTGFSQQVAVNDPEFTNVWTGIAQSVTAVDTNVQFGFYVFGSAPSTALMSLYAGNGIFANPLKQVTINTPQASGLASVLVMADFRDIDLVVGQQYTFRLSLPSEGLPPLGTFSIASASYAGPINPYAGGRFWFSGASYDQSLPAFADRDLAFSMQGMTTAVPEPGTWVMLVCGFGMVGGIMRRTGGAARHRADLAR